MLRRKHDFLEKEFAKSDITSDSSLIATLREAKGLLEQEQAKLERGQVLCGARCWSKVSMTIFPAKVGLRIQRVIDAFDAIPDFLQMEEKAVVALQNTMTRRAPSLPFRDDYRYVPLKVTQLKVHTALENSHCSPVVLLHGRPGKGKSTLAGHVGLHYQRTCKNPEAPFELVVFLECGPKADTITNQFKLAQLLGHNTSESVVTQEDGQAGSDVANTSAAGVPQQRRQSGSDVAIQNRLSGLRKNQRLLIILDDVWDGEFLQRMLNLCGAEVKFLVTSQDGDLCSGLSLSHRAIQIQIEDVQEDVAMEILASHVGFTGKQIPARIQGVARKMIEGTEGNPLALASVARAIDYDRSDELEVWEAASENFLRLLQSKSPAYTLGVPYSKTFWLATQLSIESLNEDAQKLLILLHMCEAPSVPEEVLHVLYLSGVFQGGTETFETSRIALKSRGLVKIRSESFEYRDHRKQYSWSAHSLQHSFIEDEMSGHKETMLKKCKERVLSKLASQSNDTSMLAGAETKSTTDFSAEADRMVLLSLCALYFQEQYSEKAALNLNMLPNRLNNLGRDAIEPIALLLALPLSERWTKAAQWSAKQIYLKYIYNSALHECGILDLLALPVSILPTLRALKDMATVESETTFIDESSGDLMKALLAFAGNVSTTGDITIATAAIRVLFVLCRNKLHHGIIMSSGMLDTIVKILSSDSHPLLFESTSILVRLMYVDIDRAIEIVQHPSIVTFLVKSVFNEDNRRSKDTSSMSRNDNPKLQLQAAKAFRNLTASGNITVLQRLNFPGLLEHLVNRLSEDIDVDLQVEAVRSLCNLAQTQGDETKLKMMPCSGLLEKFFNYLSDAQFHLHKGWACYVEALTYIDPARGNGVLLHTALAYARRGMANLLLGLNKEALEDLDKANEIEAGDLSTLRNRCTVRARLGDLEGGLLDADYIITQGRTGVDLQERGVLKRMMGDLSGALVDLNESLKLCPDDYEVLKHRGFVRFLLMDENGAHADARRALEVKHSRVDDDWYRNGCLGTASVDFLGYMLG